MPYDDGSHQISRVIAEQDEEVDRIQTLPQSLLCNEGEVLSSLSPCQRIPPEIWGDIFVQCLPDDEFIAISAYSAPMLLAGVCRPWRLIVLSTPRLWNSICLNRLYFREFAHFNLSSMWLGRAGKLPLFIGIWQGGFPSYQDERNIVISVLPFVSQIKNLNVGMSWPLIETLLGGQDISALTDLEIRIPNNSSRDLYHDSPRHLNISDSTPHLRTLKLAHFPHGVVTYLLPFPWAQLTEFSAYPIDFNQCFDIFRECRNLTHLSLSGISTGYDGHIRRHVLLPNLISLTLGIYRDRDIRYLWHGLTLPKLRECMFGFSSRTSPMDPWSTAKLFALLDRSSCSLHTLEIPPFTSDADVVECVQRIPSLRNIKFGPSVTKNVLSDRVSRILNQRAASDTNLDELEPLKV
ncbi:hypothetical protein PILCRDRAFT_12323 [Piloderma croceum F 1598]|uniref:Uncharacterized protein n=1 Tax=Piloderma croceum (strain F 1598) TaxID=765440 RepID=A0A0C3EXB6_PILCF|nr:hypothetical protein PILCRDRAFT_12323 [Piloderma croceum F 1598]